MSVLAGNGGERGRRIAYLSPYFWPETIGSGPYSTELALDLRRRGHQVDVLAFRPHYPTPEPYAAWADGARDRETHEGVSIRRIPAQPRGNGGFPERLRNDLRYLRAVVAASLAAGPADTDVIIAYVPGTLAALGAALIKWRTGARLIVIVHDIESGLAASLGIVRQDALIGLIRLVERLALSRADRIVVLTEGMRDELRRLGCRAPIAIVPIWAEIAPEAPLPPLDRPLLSYSGNFGKKQNLDQLVPLIRMLDRRRPEVGVVLRGDGSERPRIERALGEAGVSNTIFRDLVPASALIAAIQAAHLHLIPQAPNVANYALPSKLVSTMAAGRPFLAISEPDSPLDRLARASGAGVCVPPGNTEALFTAVDRVLGDADAMIRMGRAGQAFVRNNMDAARILESYEELIL